MVAPQPTDDPTVPPQIEPPDNPIVPRAVEPTVPSRENNTRYSLRENPKNTHLPKFLGARTSSKARIDESHAA